MGIPMVLGAWGTVAESLSVERRARWGGTVMARSVGGLLADRRYSGNAVALASAFATMFVFMAAAPFLFQQRLGLSAQAYGWVNAGIAGCMGVAMALVSLYLKRQATFGRSNPAGVARFGVGRRPARGQRWRPARLAPGRPRRSLGGGRRTHSRRP